MLFLGFFDFLIVFLSCCGFFVYHNPFSMRVRRKARCLYCSKSFIPNPRLGPRQKTCGCKKCKRLQNLAAQKRCERKNHDDYCQNRKDWRSNHSSYWKNWRKDHPDYVARNRVQSRLRKTKVCKTNSIFCNLPKNKPNSETFAGLQWFAKQTRSPFTWSIAYMLNHENRAERLQEFRSP